MAWHIVTRRLGRAGGEKERMARQRGWDQKYGDGMWEIGYAINGSFLPQHEALESVYYQSYNMYFEAHPEDFESLIKLAKRLKNPHAEATTGIDLQVPAVERYIEEQGRQLEGTEVVDVGTWQGQRSHAISERLSPLHIPCAIEPKWTLEKFWQRRKCLAIWEDE